ncbi:hypothetical protein HDE_14545 [Halotydeus destructor]|nr:hypothetical protein HDE_14545 [Halotydeus destructor]
MKLLLIAGLLAIFAAHCDGQLAGVPKCSVAEATKFDLCSAQPMVMNLNTTFPFDLPSANTYCREARASITCMKTFSSKCLTDLPKQASNLLNYGVKKHIKTVCKTPQSRRELAEKLKCNNQVMDKIDSAMVGLIDVNRRIPFMDSNIKINAICCGYYGFLDKVLIESNKVCFKSDSDYFRNYMNSFASDILELLCSNVSQNMAICDNIQFPVETIEAEPSVSFVPTLLNVLADL